MRIVLWTPGTPIGNYSADYVKEIQGEYTGPLVAVVDENDGVAIIQPMNPDTGENWASDDEALAFADRYLNGAPVPEAPTEPPLEIIDVEAAAD